VRGRKVNHAAIDRDYPREAPQTSRVDQSDPEPEEASDGTSAVGRGADSVSEWRSTADLNTGLADPRLAVWLYIAVVSMAVMFTKKWGQVLSAVSSGVKK
jgi:hypothetical protein